MNPPTASSPAQSPPPGCCAPVAPLLRRCCAVVASFPEANPERSQSEPRAKAERRHSEGTPPGMGGPIRPPQWHQHTRNPTKTQPKPNKKPAKNQENDPQKPHFAQKSHPGTAQKHGVSSHCSHPKSKLQAKTQHTENQNKHKLHLNQSKNDRQICFPPLFSAPKEPPASNEKSQI